MSIPIFHFTTDWKFPYGLTTIWNHISQVTKYPQWWPGIIKAQLVQGEAAVVAPGNQVRFTVVSPLYTLQYLTEVEDYKPEQYIAVKATGDLSGLGRWTFTHRSEETRAAFAWHVSLTPTFLRLVSHLPPVRPVMRFFHHRLMSAGQHGLEKLLRVQGNTAGEDIASAPVGH